MIRNLLVLTLLFWIAGCKEKTNDPFTDSGRGGKPASGKPAVFSAILAESFPINESTEAPGTILANETTDIQPEISGRVVSINFNEGSNVKDGSLLVKLFDADLQAQLKKLSVQLLVAEATSKRQQELLAINGTSQQDYDNATLNVSNIKADMELLKVRISQTEVKAPFSGKLGLRNISLGAYVTPSTILTNIAQVNTLKVEFSVPEKYAGEMIPGKMVSLSTIESNKKYAANVVASSNIISTDTRNLMVRARVQNPDGLLKPGAFVQVRISAGNKANGIMVPTSAVIPSTRNKKIIVKREGKAVFQDIITGYRDSARVEVIKGLNIGDTVITSGLLTIKEGMPVDVRFNRQ